MLEDVQAHGAMGCDQKSFMLLSMLWWSASRVGKMFWDKYIISEADYFEEDNIDIDE